jgi:tetratricopeptide (TPR) repeat protein
MNPLAGVLVVSTLFLTSAATAQDSDYRSYRQDSAQVRLALNGIHATIGDLFRRADSIFAALSDAYPLSPIGPLFAAGNVQAEMLDLEDNQLRDKFFTLIAEAERRAQAISGGAAERSDAEFALGVAAGYRAVYESKWGGWIAALKKGMSAKRHFQRALESDSSHCDAYLGLGSYHYWKSAKTDWINWTPIVSDDRRLGIDMLDRSLRGGVFTRETARAALAVVLINEGMYRESIAHADTLAVQFPDAKSPLWLKAKSYYAIYEWDSAIAIFDIIEHRIRATGKGNYYNLIECAYHRAHCHWGAGRYREAQSECGKALTYPASDEAKKRQKGKLNELRRMQRKLIRMLSS